MSDNILLEIKNLHAGVEGKEILKGIDLTIRRGEVRSAPASWPHTEPE